MTVPATVARLLIVAAVALASAVVVQAKAYNVVVTRIDQDLYRIDDSSPRLIIETQYCYEYVIGERAILDYEPHGTRNRIIFRRSYGSDRSCDVKGIR